MFPKNKYYYINFMNVLVTEGFIEGFEERGNYLIVYLKHTHWQTPSVALKAFTEIKTFKRLHKKDMYNSRDIANLQRLNGHAQCFLVSTDNGVLTGSELTHRHLGGIPLFRIY